MHAENKDCNAKEKRKKVKDEASMKVNDPLQEAEAACANLSSVPSKDLQEHQKIQIGGSDDHTLQKNFNQQQRGHLSHPCIG